MKFKDMMDPKLWFKSEKDRKIAIAKRDLSGGELEKELASIDGKPYVNVLQMDVDPINPKKGFVELDFNEEFVSMLQENGYSGKSDDDIVNGWFNDLCRNIMLEDMDEDVVDALKENIKENKKELGDGKVEYS